MVWLYGGEFEVGRIEINSAGDQIAVGNDGRTYCFETCLGLNDIQLTYPDFFEGATTAAVDTGIQADSLLCPTGNKVGVAVMEFAAFVNHEEFVCRVQDSDDGECQQTWAQYYDELVANKTGNDTLPPANTGLNRVLAEAGQTILLIEQSANEPQHGTACLGIVSAQDNGFGVTGMAHNAQGYFFPIVSLEEGERETSAMASAIQTLPAGSSINMSYGPGGGNVVTSGQAMYALVTVAGDSLITTCISAGNDGVELNGEAGDDSGAIIVGACTPGQLALPQGVCNDGNIAKMASCFSWASRWSGEVRESGPLLAVCAWGTSVTTVGYGDLFEGQNIPTVGAENLEINQLRTYTGPTPQTPTGGFNGTSSSAPQMTGAAAWIQGFAQMFYGQFLTSAQVRTVLASAGDYTCSGNAEDGSGLGIPGDIPEICQDFDPEETPRPIGRFPGGAFRDCAINVLVRLGSDFDGSVEIYTGQRVGGNSFSLGETDGNRFRVRSEFRGQGPGPENLTYFGSGATIDFGVKFNTGYDPVVVDNSTLNINAAAPAPLVVMIPFAFNQITLRYVALGVEVITGVPTPYNYQLGVVGGQQVIPAADFYTVGPEQNNVGVVDTRIYTLGLGYMGNQPLTGVWDEVSLETNVPFGGNDP
jgi:hypothetical protein